MVTHNNYVVDVQKKKRDCAHLKWVEGELYRTPNELPHCHRKRAASMHDTPVDLIRKPMV